jgi:hypothetical protein
MTSLFGSTMQNGDTKQRDLTWSRSEKVVARKAFDAAPSGSFRR